MIWKDVLDARNSVLDPSNIVLDSSTMITPAQLPPLNNTREWTILDTAHPQEQHLRTSTEHSSYYNTPQRTTLIHQTGDHHFTPRNPVQIKREQTGEDHSTRPDYHLGSTDHIQPTQQYMQPTTYHIIETGTHHRNSLNHELTYSPQSSDTNNTWKFINAATKSANDATPKHHDNHSGQQASNHPTQREQPQRNPTTQHHHTQTKEPKIWTMIRLRDSIILLHLPILWHLLYSNLSRSIKLTRSKSAKD